MARVFQDAKQLRRLGKRDCPWTVEWYQGKKRCSKTIGPKALAVKFAALKEAEIVQRSSGMTIAKPWDDFVTEYKANVVAAWRSDRSRAEAERILDLFKTIAKPRIVADVDKLMLDQFKAKRLKMPGKKKGDKLAAATVKKELRTLLAALAVAVDWNYLAAVPTTPKVDGFETDKRFVTADHFEAILKALDVKGTARLPDPLEHRGLPGDAADWWRALLVTLWLSGLRIGAALELRWTDVDLDAGIALSRAKHNKSKKDQRVKIGPVVELLRAIKGFGEHVFPWHHDRTTLMNEFARIQQAAGIELPCAGEHEHTEKCHVYGFHDFRRAHATYNYGRVDDRALQQQMGHASFVTTQRYVRYAEAHKDKAYDMYVPAGVAKLAGSR